MQILAKVQHKADRDKIHDRLQAKSRRTLKSDLAPCLSSYKMMGVLRIELEKTQKANPYRTVLTPFVAKARFYL